MPGPSPIAVANPQSPGSREHLVGQLDLSNASSVLAETCSALALSLHDGDLEAAERLFTFVVDQTADRRVAVTAVLTPMLLGPGASTPHNRTDNESFTALEFVRVLRRPVSTLGGQGVVFHTPDDDHMAVMSELTALLLDDAHVPVHVRRGLTLPAISQTTTRSSVAAVALGVASLQQLERLQATVRQVRRAGTSVVVMADPEVVPPEVARSAGASAVAWQPGEIAEALLRLRGPLTRGEAEVLRFAADGYTNVRIAHELGISLSAVKARLEGSYAKLRAADRTHAVAIALRQHWIH